MMVNNIYKNNARFMKIDEMFKFGYFMQIPQKLSYFFLHISSIEKVM